MRVYYTPEMDTALISLRVAKIPWSRVARRVGVSVESAKVRVREMGRADLMVRVPMSGDRLWTDEQVTTLRKMWAAGVFAKHIAGRIGRSELAVFRKAHELGLPRRKKTRI